MPLSSISRSLPHLAAGITALCIGLVFVMVAAFALPVFSQSAAGNESVFTWVWNPGQGHFGILPMICGSLALACTSLCLAWPMALGLCCWLLGQEMGTPARSTATTSLGKMSRLAVAGLIRFMTTIPTVVYGFTAVFLLVPLARRILGQGSGLCLFTAVLVLTLLLLPTLVLVMESALKPRLEQLRLTTAALGFTPMETLTFFVLPAARRGLFTAAVLGFGRALGDTLISLMLAGNAPQIPLGLSSGLRTLTAHMALVTSNDAGGAAYNSLFAAGAVLLILNGGISLLLRRLGR